MSIDTKYTYNALPFNVQDQRYNPYANRQGLEPSYVFKKKRTVWLSSAFATTTRNGGSGSTTYYEFSFDITPFQLYNQTKLSVISFTVNQNNAQPFYVKITNLQFKNEAYFSSDKEGFPFIYVSHVGATGMLGNDKISLTLPPQSINNITLKVNDSFASRDTGYTISAGGGGNFIIGLLFEDDDQQLDNAVSQYQ